MAGYSPQGHRVKHGAVTEQSAAKKKNKQPSRCGKKGTLIHCWWECKLVQPLWRTVQRFLKKLKTQLPF